MTIRIAMWSGPRNISTAMMRSWENRSDCSVVDEPFYACYLAETGVDHPCREAIIASQNTERAEVVRELTETPIATELFYQKQMTHHIPEDMNMDWCGDMRHCFLIRDPAEVIASYLQKMPSVNVDDIGIVRQASLFDQISDITGIAPVVIDSNDVLEDPAGILQATCDALGVTWEPNSMLQWPTGRRSSDGAWASHWYQNVERSTGFGKKPQRQAPRLAATHRKLAEAMAPCYQKLAEQRLKPT